MTMMVVIMIIALCAVLAQSSNEKTGKGVGQHYKDVDSNDDQNSNNDACNTPLLGGLV